MMEQTTECVSPCAVRASDLIAIASACCTLIRLATPIVIDLDHRSRFIT
jgi:hypothetical protein